MKFAAIGLAAVVTLFSLGAYAHMQREHGSNENHHTPPGGHHMGMGHQAERMHGQRPHHKHGPRQRDAHENRASGAHDEHAQSSTLSRGDRSPASLALDGVNRKMHAAMSIEFTGDADLDFVKSMIPHHEGAVDMAKVVLAFGKDPAVKKLAEEIVKAQETEIALMKDWIKAKQ